MTQALHPFEDPLRRCLKLCDWPDQDQQAWKVALTPGDLLDGTVGPGQHWCPDTREKYRKGYGRWLTFLITSGRCDRAASPAARITPAAVAAYIDELRTQIAPWTLWGRLAELLAVARALAHGEDWSWLRRLVGRLEANLQPSKDKHVRLRPASEIYNWALKQLRTIELDTPRRLAPVHYRDALAIALLIACPTMRLRNLAMIEIGPHLVRLSDRYFLRFEATEMKARKPVEVPVPDALTQHLDRYISDVRQSLLARASPETPQSERLWITQYGEPMGEKMLYERIVVSTKRAFGTSINPHLFRDCAVTSVALEDARHIGIAAPILGHTDLRTTEAHYIQAQQIAAGRKLQASLKTLRRYFQTRRPK